MVSLDHQLSLECPECQHPSMTSFIAWVGVDSRSPSSLYLASDSRISWTPTIGWNHGRKLFASRSSPDALGYVGEVLFPSLALAQITSAIELGALFPANASPPLRIHRVESALKASHDSFPQGMRHPFTIVYAYRESSGMSSQFHIVTFEWAQGSQWTRTSVGLPESSGVVCMFGSGEQVVQKWISRWTSSSQGGTSRAVFSAFCNALSSHEDPQTGGAPQLVGLYRTGPSRVIGISHETTPTLLGMAIDPMECDTDQRLEWRNPAFERCDAFGARLSGAQSHHIPPGLGSP